MSRPKKSSHLARLKDLVEEQVRVMPAREEGGATLLVDPALCRMNSLHRRKEIDGPELDSMISSLKGSGQIMPAKGWEIPEGSVEADGCRYVLIYGARRRAAAQAAGLKLKLEVVEQPSTAELFRLMYLENSERKDYSAYERGLELQAYLQSGEASNAKELAELLGEAQTTVWRHLKIADIPEEAVRAYPTLQHLTVRSAEQLIDAMKGSDEARDRMIAAGRQWKEAGRSGDPTTWLVKAARGIRDSAGRAATTVLIQSNSKSVGRVTGLEDATQPLILRLEKNAPAEIRRELERAIAKVIKGTGS